MQSKVFGRSPAKQVLSFTAADVRAEMVDCVVELRHYLPAADQIVARDNGQHFIVATDLKPVFIDESLELEFVEWRKYPLRGKPMADAIALVINNRYGHLLTNPARVYRINDLLRSKILAAERAVGNVEHL
ncbi:hypothetical protein vBSlqSZDD2_36 [Serratia phage vB_SlqS_ZDD2]|nr:hypothetical protein vBSlqSZDD2_36 [Serratia phage vB_SlqS_ZDD2]